MGGACGVYGGQNSHIQGFGGETLGKEPLGRPKCRWEDNIKMIFRKWDVGLWTGSSWLRTGTDGGNL